MECAREKNKVNCTCTYTSCNRRGVCCECISFHLQNDELPGCVFSPEAERTYDRSVSAFIASRKK